MKIRGNSNRHTSRGRKSRGCNRTTKTTVALVTVTSADTLAVDGVKDYIISLFRDEVSAATGVPSQRISVLAVNTTQNTTTHVDTSLVNRVWDAPNIGAGIQVFLESILWNVLSKEIIREK